MDVNEREIASWDDFGDSVTLLAKSVLADEFVPDCILAITRGGLILGGALAHRLGIKDVYVVNIEYYRGNGIDDVRLAQPRILEPALDAELIAGRNVLVVDDVAESGATLGFVHELFGADVTLRSAVWFSKPQSVMTPDFSAASTSKWIVFPWSPFSPFGDSIDAG